MRPRRPRAGLFAATFGCLAAGLAVALALVRPLTLAEGSGSLAVAAATLAVAALFQPLRRRAGVVGPA